LDPFSPKYQSLALQGVAKERTTKLQAMAAFYLTVFRHVNLLFIQSFIQDSGWTAKSPAVSESQVGIG